MKPDTIVKLRDAFIMASDALQEELEGIAPKSAVTTVPEQIFVVLKFEAQSGERLGDFETADKKNNTEENWTHAFNILKQANATISNRFHGGSYLFTYWIYSERIFRQRLKT